MYLALTLQNKKDVFEKIKNKINLFRKKRNKEKNAYRFKMIKNTLRHVYLSSKY